MMLFHEELFSRSQCSCCQHEISGLAVECLDCYNGNLRLCLECFADASEIGQHKADHQFRYFDSGSLVLSKSAPGLQASKWSAREEIRLLDAIEQYGFGNWQDISKHIETKAPSEAKSQYVNQYVVGTLGELTWSAEIPNEVTRIIPNSHLQKPVDHTIPCDDGPLSPSLTKRLSPLEIGSDEMLQLGYMPNRDDYEKEYDNEAEQLVSQLCFTSEDEEVDVGLKLAMVDMYTARLRERARRKRMIRDYQLVTKFFRKDKAKSHSLCEVNGNKDILKGPFNSLERTLYDKLRTYMQFFNSREFEYFVRNMSKEVELRFRLNELSKYRCNGIRMIEDCSDFERNKSSLAIVRGKRNLEPILESENIEGRSGNKRVCLPEKFAAPLLVRQLQLAVPQSSPKSKSVNVNSVNEENVSGNPSAARNPTQQLFSSEDSSLRNYMGSNESGRALFPQGAEEPKTTELMEVLTQTTRESSSLLKEKPRASADRYTADFIPSVDLLTDSELQLCLKIRLTPAQYLTSKTSLLLAIKPKGIGINEQSEGSRVIPCPQVIPQEEWEQVTTFFKRNYSS